MKNLLVVFIFVSLLGCGDEGVVLDGGVAPSAPNQVLPDAIVPVPPDVAELLWGDLHALLDDLTLMLSEDKKLGDKFPEARWHGERWHLPLKQICLILEQREHYTKYINAGGVAIIGGRHVDDRFFYAAQEIVLSMTSKRPEVRASLTPNDGFRMILFSTAWGIAEIPEVIPARSSGASLGYCIRDDYCASGVSFYQNKLFFAHSFVHEFAHAMHYVIQGLDATFQARLEAAYANALKVGGFWPEGTYGYTDVYEYWAVGVTTWFDTVAHSKSSDILAPQFRAKDPRLYALLNEWLPVIPVLHIQNKW